MGVFERRRARKMLAELERTRAEHEAFLDSCELLCEWEVRFDLDEARVSVFGQHAEYLSDEEREWLDTYVAVAYIVKMLCNLRPRDLWPDVLSGKALAAAVVEEQLTFTNAPTYIGEPVGEATHIYAAQVFHNDERHIPFLQTPYEPADGNEEVLAPWSLAALLTVLRSEQRHERRPIDHAIELLEQHRIEGDWAPGELSQVELTVTVELAAEGLVPDGLMPVEDDDTASPSDDELAEGLDAIRKNIAEARQGGGFRTASGELDLRAVAVDMWEGAPTIWMQTIKELWHPASGSASGERWYEEELARHWEGLGPDQREAELVKLVRLRNFFDSADSDDDADITVPEATVAEKVTLLAYAVDATYGTDYSERVYLNPLQFGVHVRQA